jgi:hypothetical protein
MAFFMQEKFPAIGGFRPMLQWIRFLTAFKNLYFFNLNKFEEL